MRCADADVVNRHEPKPKATAGKLGAPDTLALGAIGGRDTSRAAISRLGARKFTPVRRPSDGGIVSHRVVPGAPLMTRGAAQKGFDLQLAASYQVWGALLTPVIVRLLIAAGGGLYGRDIWVPPDKVAGGDRLAAVRAADCRHDADVARTRVFLGPAGDVGLRKIRWAAKERRWRHERALFGCSYLAPSRGIAATTRVTTLLIASVFFSSVFTLALPMPRNATCREVASTKSIMSEP